jgi:MFS family permease
MPKPRTTLILLLACIAQFMLVVDDTITNVALPTLARDLHFSVANLSWVVNAYLLTFGGLLLVGGRLADRFGARRMPRS